VLEAWRHHLEESDIVKYSKDGVLVSPLHILDCFIVNFVLDFLVWKNLIDLAEIVFHLTSVFFQ
jgi:hypothetical protein